MQTHSNERFATLELLLHCSSIDGEINEAERQIIEAIVAEGGAEDRSAHQQYLETTLRTRVTDDRTGNYLKALLRQIDSATPERLLWHCAQICVADGFVCLAEELLLERLSQGLQLAPGTARSFSKLAWQLRCAASPAVISK